jgi:hypothetical protein
MKPRGVLVLSMVAVLAAAASAGTPADEARNTSVSAGLEVSDTDSRRVYLAASTNIDQNWSLDAGLTRADLELPDFTTQSTLASAGVSRAFGDFSVGAGFRHSEIDGVSSSREWLVRGSANYQALRFGLEVGRREATLDPSPFVEDLGPGTGVVSGISRCRVDALGYRGSVNLDRETWSGFVSLRLFDYGDYDCALEITSGGGPPGNGPPPHARGRALGRRLAATTLDTAIGAVSRLVPREVSLLESSAALGFSTPVAGRWIGGIEAYRDVEKIDGSEYLTGVLTAGTLLTDTWSLELSLGYTAADVIDDSAFAGVRVTAAF